MIVLAASASHLEPVIWMISSLVFSIDINPMVSPVWNEVVTIKKEFEEVSTFGQCTWHVRTRPGLMHLHPEPPHRCRTPLQICRKRIQCPFPQLLVWKWEKWVISNSRLTLHGVWAQLVGMLGQLFKSLKILLLPFIFFVWRCQVDFRFLIRNGTHFSTLGYTKGYTFPEKPPF
jgi:hypothetical protein